VEADCIRVLIADDSVFMRTFIKEIVEKDPQIKVVAVASDGKSAFEMCQETKPDLVLMDMTMGEYDGIYGLKKIMETCPTPVVILSALGNTDMEPILKALSLGAVDYINKPVGNVNMNEVAEPLVQMIRHAASLNVKPLQEITKKSNTHSHSFSDDQNYEVIVIGASTGGPSAVEAVICNLPGNLNIPVLVAQHMPSNFVPSFASRLNS